MSTTLEAKLKAQATPFNNRKHMLLSAELMKFEVLKANTALLSTLIDGALAVGSVEVHIKICKYCPFCPPDLGLNP
eukprot:2625650-Amphidinium_carterae.1